MNVSKIQGKFSLINIPTINISSNTYFKKSLYEIGITSTNLNLIGINKSIAGNGLSFTKQDAYISALGEFCERYCSTYESNQNLIYDNYINLKEKYNCYNLMNIKFFNSKQYNNKNFKLDKIDINKKIHWKYCKNYINNEDILLPYFIIGLDNSSKDGRFHINTSTGASSHETIEKAILGGFLECIERNAFCKFWYLQNQQKNNKISSEYILKKYPNNKKIQDIYNNNKIKIVTFNLCEYSHTPTFATFILFKHKDQIFQSLGSASRLNIEDALIKSCMEAYQGIEFAKICYDNNKDILSNIEDFSVINNFDKHFAFYNINPHLRDKSPIIKDAFDWNNNYTNHIQDEYSNHIKAFDKKELIRVGINELYYTEMTTPDVEQLGMKVVKVITPKLHLLTGNFNYPYLGLFDENINLFTEYPHPFP